MHLNSSKQKRQCCRRYIRCEQGTMSVPILNIRLAVVLLLSVWRHTLTPHELKFRGGKQWDLLDVLQPAGIRFQRCGVFHHFVHRDEKEDEIELCKKKTKKKNTFVNKQKTKHKRLGTLIENSHLSIPSASA